MPQLMIIPQEGETRTVEAPIGSTVMEAVRNAGLDEMLALCDGCCSCATCHIFIDEPYLAILPALTNDEDDLLDTASHRSDQSRLSC